MKRLLLACGIALAFGAVLTGTALAISSTINSKAQLSADKTSAFASGTIICSAGSTASVTVIITQSSGKTDTTGSGNSDDITCTGMVQPWTATVPVNLSGEAFKSGPAVVLYQASACTVSTDPSIPPFCENTSLATTGIHLQK